MQNQPSMSVPGAAASNPDAGRRGGLMVVIAGVVTTTLALLGVWWLDNNTTDFNIMGWYGNYVIPAGALIVGAVAGSGYGIASYLTGSESGAACSGRCWPCSCLLMLPPSTWSSARS